MKQMIPTDFPVGKRPFWEASFNMGEITYMYETILTLEVVAILDSEELVVLDCVRQTDRQTPLFNFKAQRSPFRS